MYLNCHQLVNVKNTGHKQTDVPQQWNPACGNTGISCINNITNDGNALPICTAMEAMPASMKTPPVGGALSSSMHDAWAINSLNENNFLYNNVWWYRTVFGYKLISCQTFLLLNNCLFFLNACAAYCSTFITCIQLCMLCNDVFNNIMLVVLFAQLITCIPVPSEVAGNQDSTFLHPTTSGLLELLLWLCCIFRTMWWAPASQTLLQKLLLDSKLIIQGCIDLLHVIHWRLHNEIRIWILGPVRQVQPANSA